MNKYIGSSRLFVLSISELSHKIPNRLHLKTTLNPIRSYILVVCKELFVFNNLKLKNKLKNYLIITNRSFLYMSDDNFNI